MLVCFVYTGTVLYTSIRHLVLRQVTESLLTEKQIIEEQLEHTDTVPDFSDIFNHEIQVNVYAHPLQKSQHFLDTFLFDSTAQRMVAFRFLVYKNNTADNRGYIITTSKSIEQEKDLLYEILGIIILLFAVLSLLLIIIISSISRRLWATFYNTLEKMAQYDLKTGQEFIPTDTSITEFRQLNSVLRSLTDKIRSEYVNLKEFSENASHEIQTPLSVIRLRIDQMLQSPYITKELAEQLVMIGQSVNKISRINQSLTLISKIENNQFSESVPVDIDRKIRDVLAQLNDFAESLKLEITLDSREPVIVDMNPDLADSLISNLLANAVKHNLEKGRIDISLDNTRLIIQNTGTDPGVDPEKLFLRFKKARHSNDSPGLGLAIVKKIADLYNMQISYTFKDDIHTFHLVFPPAVLSQSNS
jgi:signal transduction histidine kinase